MVVPELEIGRNKQAERDEQADRDKQDGQDHDGRNVRESRVFGSSIPWLVSHPEHPVYRCKQSFVTRTVRDA